MAQKYTNVAVDINGQRLLEASDVEVSRKGNSVKQLTLAKGYAGQSRGAPEMSIKITNGVPSVGIEYDAGDALESLDIISVTLYRDDGSFLTTTGVVEEDTFKKAVNANASYEFSVIAELKKWQR